MLSRIPLPFPAATSSARPRISQPEPSLPAALRVILAALCWVVSLDERQKLGHILSLFLSSCWFCLLSAYTFLACYTGAETNAKAPSMFTALYCSCLICLCCSFAEAVSCLPAFLLQPNTPSAIFLADSIPLTCPRCGEKVAESIRRAVLSPLSSRMQDRSYLRALLVSGRIKDHDLREAITADKGQIH